MIQFLNTPPTQSRLDTRTSDGTEQWGQWSGRKRYSLEVTQHPIRARMCGFGDKDRRPLAPAAVAKLVVQRDDNSIVDVDDIDCSFFVVTVDLWSADGKQEMNLVLHPSSADRYIPPHTAKARRRGTSVSTQQPQQRGGSGNQTPASRSTPTPSHYRTNDTNQTSRNTSPLTASEHTPDGGNTGYFNTQNSPVTQDPTATNHPTWGVPASADRNSQFPPSLLPPVPGFGSSSQEPTSSDGWPMSYVPQMDAHWQQPNPPQQHPTYSQDGFIPPPDPMYSHYPQPAHLAYYQTHTHAPNSNNHHPTPNPPPHPMSLPLPRHTYTRTLVGPLSANATRLCDEHRKPGIFFLFQDLSVRTEGTFRLRMRLMNVGAPPAPEPGSLRIHTGLSPVLAQVFTEPFTVFSAKRFPGVPDTTALSIAFGNQGQKLPLRNRNGSSGKRRRRDDSGSEDESDGA